MKIPKFSESQFTYLLGGNDSVDLLGLLRELHERTDGCALSIVGVRMSFSYFFIKLVFLKISMMLKCLVSV